jgi:hypothetical protein
VDGGEDWQGGWLPERAVLHDRIVAAHLIGKRQRAEGTRAAYFTAGGGASGRTRALFDVEGEELTAAELADPTSGRADVVAIDPDRIKKLIPEFQVLHEAGDQYAALGVRAEAGAIARRIVDEAQLRGFSYLCYTTGSSPGFLDHLAATKAAGYKVQVTMTSRPTNEAITRSMQRGDRSLSDMGRYAHIGELKESHVGASRNLELWKDTPFVDNWRLYDTSSEVWADEAAAEDTAPGFYIDVDSDDSFLGLAVPRYLGRTRKQDSDVVDVLLYAAERGDETLPALPPLTDDG